MSITTSFTFYNWNNSISFNRFFNPGRLLFIQKRMGKNCEFFFAIKFRTMTTLKKLLENMMIQLKQIELHP